MPDVTVLMPVRNGGRYLEMAVASILGQTGTSLRLLVVDDCSTDGCVDRLPTAGHAGRVDVIRAGRPLGVAAALNLGLAAADTEVIARMDADDIAHPRRLSTQLERLEQASGAALIFGSVQEITETGRVRPSTRRAVSLNDQENRVHLSIGNHLCHPTLVAPTAVLRRLGGYDTSQLFEDADLWYRASVAGFPMVQMSNVVLAHRQHPGNATKRSVNVGNQMLSASLARHLVSIYGRPVDASEALGILSYTNSEAALRMVCSLTEREIIQQLSPQAANFLRWRVARWLMLARRSLLAAVRVAPSLVPSLLGTSIRLAGQVVRRSTVGGRPAWTREMAVYGELG